MLPKQDRVRPRTPSDLEHKYNLGELQIDADGSLYRLFEGEKEYLNPPMVIGVEYRTAERWNGKPVYTALIDCGKFSTNGIKAVPHGMSVNQMIRWAGTTDYYGIALPYYTADAGSLCAHVWAHKTAVFVQCNIASWAEFNCKTQIWYTK